MQCRLLILGLFCSLAFAQMKLTVQQLTDFVKSSIGLKHEDKRVAEYLRKVRLAYRLEDSVIADLQRQGAGPKTVEALRELRRASLDLPKPPAPAQRTVIAAIAPPGAQEQKDIIEEVRKYALSYVKSLPDFICTQVTRRYVDPSGLEFWQQQDVITERLSYFEQKEDYKVVLVNSRPTTMNHYQLNGASSSGEFGTMMKEIFDRETQTEFHWERWATLRGRRMHVFAYRVAQANSKWRIDYQRQQDLTPGYRGLVYVDRDNLMVMRITLEAENIPPSFPVQQAMDTLDYDYAKIGDREFVLPLRAEVRMRSGKFLTKNDVEFRLYRKFATEAVISYETPEPLPEDKTKEQPPKP